MTRRALVPAVAVALAVVLLVPGAAGAAKKAQVDVSIPDPGQLAAARLEFKAKGTAKPKIKVKLKNADALPDGVAVASQAAYEKQKKKKKGKRKKKGRAVALLAIANAASDRARAAGGDVPLTVQVTSGRSISSLDFDQLPSRSRTFLSVLGAEPQAERNLAEEVFDLEDDELPEDEDGDLDLDEATDLMKLKTIGEPRIITNDLLDELFPERAIESAISGAIGPPGTVNAYVWSFITSLPPPMPVQGQVDPFPTGPSVLFAAVEFSAPVYGAQISQTTDNPLQLNSNAMCDTGPPGFRPGSVSRGAGPFLGKGVASFRLECHLTEQSRVVFANVPFGQPVSQGQTAARMLPYTISDYDPGRRQLGEALSGPSAFPIKY